MPYQLYTGDCLDYLPTLPDNSVDLVATDPPYGIAFMGKQWDQALPDPQTWVECFRVLKPGGSALVMSGSRLDCLWRLCRDLEAAGFELSQTALYWVYRSGFPKGGDLSKMADAAAGAEREVVGESWDGGWCRTQEIHKRQGYRPNTYSEAWPVKLTAPATPLAVALDGWFTKGKVKPAVEVIIWARKPISEKTELANMVRWGVGGVNCGQCMVPFGEGGHPAEMYGESYMRSGTDAAEANNNSHLGFAKKTNTCADRINPAGRFPANVICLQNALGDGSRYFDVDAWAAEHGYTEDGWAEAAEAGLLQIAKPSKAEKNAGCQMLPTNQVKGGGGTNNTEDDVCGKYGSVKAPPKNTHNTVKPVRLFAYLIDFLAPTNATVLDPFTGSGTTGVAALLSHRHFLGCELDPQYAQIAHARLQHAAQQPQPTTQLPLELT